MKNANGRNLLSKEGYGIHGFHVGPSARATRTVVFFYTHVGGSVCRISVPSRIFFKNRLKYLGQKTSFITFANVVEESGASVFAKLPLHLELNKAILNVQFKKYIASVALGVMSLMGAKAQDLMPEQMPSRPTAERIVKEVAPLAGMAVQAGTAEVEATLSYNATFGESVVRTALQYLGARYSLGSSGPNVFDCSGFTSFVYGKENVSILRTSRSQFTQGTPIACIKDLRKGDLVFFGGRGNTRSVGHVGIVTDVDPSGNNFSFVHASNKGVKVSDSSEAYYNRRYIGARRIVEN